MIYITTLNHDIDSVIIAILGFVTGITWLALIITDKENKYITIIRKGSLIEFAKIIITYDSTNNEKENT